MRRRSAASSSRRRAAAGHRLDVADGTAGSRPRRRRSPRAGRRPREATTGTPQAIASSAARPKLSVSLGSRKTSASRRTPGRSTCSPRNSTSAARPSAATWRLDARRARDRRRRGAAAPGAPARTRAKTSTTSSTRLSGRKFETWTSTGDRGSAARGRGRRAKAVDVDEVRDDVDRDGVGDAERLVRRVAPARRDGVVTASLAAIEKRVSGRKLGSLPTSVMSVPCSVVTSAGRRPGRRVGGQHLARQVGAGRVREGVVGVDDVEPLAARRPRRSSR